MKVVIFTKHNIQVRLIVNILNGYQALFVCPTTLLASQHFEGIKSRLEIFDIKVAKLDGRVTTKEKNSIKKDFQDGKIDLIVGTHSLLSIKGKNISNVV